MRYTQTKKSEYRCLGGPWNSNRILMTPGIESTLIFKVGRFWGHYKKTTYDQVEWEQRYG